MRCKIVLMQRKASEKFLVNKFSDFVIDATAVVVGDVVVAVIDVAVVIGVDAIVGFAIVAVIVVDAAIADVIFFLIHLIVPK